MDLTAFLDVVIGLGLVYLGASLFVTIANEYIAQFFNLRAKQLTADLKKLVDAPDVVEKLAANPALGPFFGAAGRAGTYVDPQILAQHVIGGLRAGVGGIATVNELRGAIDALPDSTLKKGLGALAQTASGTVDEFVRTASGWFDGTLTAMGEVYKQRLQVMSFVIGLVIAVAFNLDTMSVAAYLHRDKEARSAAVAVAAELVDKTDKATFAECSTQMTDDQGKLKPKCARLKGLADAVAKRNETLGKLPIGWPASAAVGGVPLWVVAPLGWILTALAISLGASFWFDLLNRLVNIRHGMRKPEAELKPPA